MMRVWPARRTGRTSQQGRPCRARDPGYAKGSRAAIARTEAPGEHGRTAARMQHTAMLNSRTGISRVHNSPCAGHT